MFIFYFVFPKSLLSWHQGTFSGLALTPAEQELTAKVTVPKGLQDDNDGKDGDGDDDTYLLSQVLSQVLSQGLHGTYLMLTATLEGDAIIITTLKMRTLCPSGLVTSPGLAAGKWWGLDLSSEGC